MVHRSHWSPVQVAAWASVALLVWGTPGCSRDKGPPTKGALPVKLTLASTAFAAGRPIPRKYTGDGQDASPPLAWSNLPDGTKELALIVDDPDAPTPPWVHWVIYKVPADAGALAEGIAAAADVSAPAGALQGRNSWKTLGYRGPAPPPGRPHHYHFKLYALDTQLNLKAGADKEALLAAMAGHILAEGELVGTYQR